MIPVQIRAFCQAMPQGQANFHLFRPSDLFQIFPTFQDPQLTPQRLHLSLSRFPMPTTVTFPSSPLFSSNHVGSPSFPSNQNFLTQLITATYFLQSDSPFPTLSPNPHVCPYTPNPSTFHSVLLLQSHHTSKLATCFIPQLSIHH